MSWDVLLLNIPSHVETVEDVPDDLDLNLGPRAETLARLQATLPRLDLSDSTWGLLDGADFSIEFNIGTDDPIAAIMLHVRGGDGSIDPIRSLCRSLGWRALDTGDGTFLDFDGDAARGLRTWRDYRDVVIDEERSAGAEVQVEPKHEGIRVDAATTKPKGRPVTSKRTPPRRRA